MPSINRLSGKVVKTPSTQVDPDRYEFIDLSNVEPDLGVPSTNNALSSSDINGQRKWIKLSDNFEVDETSNLVVVRIVAGTF
jgi:hypothetical protein